MVMSMLTMRMMMMIAIYTTCSNFSSVAQALPCCLHDMVSNCTSLHMSQILFTQIQNGRDGAGCFTASFSTCTTPLVVAALHSAQGPPKKDGLGNSCFTHVMAATDGKQQKGCRGVVVFGKGYG